MSKANEQKSNLMNASLLGGLLSIIRLLAGLIKNKATVVFLGASGVGLLSQANEVWLLTVAVGSLMLAGGITTQMKRHTSVETHIKYLRTAWTTQFILLLIIAVFALSFSTGIAEYLFKGGGSATWIPLIILAVPLTVFSSGLLEGVVLALNHYRFYIYISALATIASSTVIIVGIWKVGLHWAFIGWTLNGALLFLGYLFVLRKDIAIASIFKFKIHWPELKSLLTHGAFVLLASAIQGLCMIGIRGDVLERLGHDALGLIQVPIAATLYYTPFLTNGLWGHFHPNISAKHDSPDRFDELIKNLNWINLLQFSFALFLLGYGKIFIQLIYSSDFLPAYGYFFEYLVGNCFYFSAFLFGVYFIAMAKAPIYLLGVGLYYVVWLVYTRFHIDDLQLLAVARGQMIAAVVVFMLCLLWLLRHVHIKRLYRAGFYFFGSLFFLIAEYMLIMKFKIEWAGYVMPIVYISAAWPLLIKRHKRT